MYIIRMVRPGPQREIFAGGTKIYAGPSKLGEEQKKRSSLKFGLSFSPKLGEEQKKKSSRKKVLRIANWAGRKKFLLQN